LLDDLEEDPQEFAEMLILQRQRQPSSQLINLATWARDEDFAVFPIGSTPKRLLVCPQTVTEPFLIPKHRYLFKVASGWKSQQMWSEIPAYELARPLKLAVPAAFAAVDTNTGEAGVLVEWFYGYPDDLSPSQFVSGSDLLQRTLPYSASDRKKGRPHALRDNMVVCRAYRVEDAGLWWASTFAFDALIGNTDRHPENWGLLLTRANPTLRTFTLSPIFDNGTSLGYEPVESKLRGWSPSRLSQYVSFGAHHCGLARTDTRGAGHIDLCARLRQTVPEASAMIQEVIQLEDAYIESVVNWCTGFDCQVRFSSERASFVASLVRARRDRLAHAMGV
jgi:HipA-like C-terminal domain